MQTAQIRLYSLGFGNVRTYIMAIAFIAANIVLPQLCHMVPQLCHMAPHLFLHTRWRI